MKKIIYLIFFLGILCPGNAQPVCADSSLHLRYLLPGAGKFAIENICNLRDGGRVYLGVLVNERGDARDRKSTFLIRTNPGGTVRWCKTGLPALHRSDIKNCHLTELASGNIVLGGVKGYCWYENNQFTCGDYMVSIFSGDGELITEKNLKIMADEPVEDEYIIRDMLMLKPYGADSMILVLRTLLENCNGSNFYNYSILILNHDGNTVLRENLVFNNLFAGFTAYQIDGSHLNLYGVGTTYGGCVDIISRQPELLRITIDLVNKKVTGEKSWCMPKLSDYIFRWLGGYGELIRYYSKIYINESKHSLFILPIDGYTASHGDSLNRYALITELDQNFMPVRTEILCGPYQYRYYRPEEYHISFRMDLYADSAFNRYIWLAGNADNQTHFAIMDRSGRQTFGHRKNTVFNINPGERYIPEFVMADPDPGYLASWKMPPTDQPDSIFEVLNIVSHDTLQSCTGSPEHYFTTFPAEVSPVSWELSYEFRDYAFRVTDLNPVLTDLPVQRRNICSVHSFCDSLSLHAPELLCNINEPLTITAHKNPECSNRVAFYFDTLQVSSFVQSNDTTLQLRFNHSWEGYVRARTGNCSMLNDSVFVRVNKAGDHINLGPDFNYCPGQTYTLRAGNPGFIRYTWQDGSHNPDFLVSRPGTYSVTATDTCGNLAWGSITCKEVTGPLEAGEDTSICRLDDLVLTASPGFNTYHWYTVPRAGESSSRVFRLRPLVNTLAIVSSTPFEGCELKDTVRIQVNDCPQYMFFPTAFTPNNDGLNDFYKPLCAGALLSYELRIYNRWGELLFRSADPAEGWDGKPKGEVLKTDVYTWTCTYQFKHKTIQHEKGTLTLIR